MWNGIKFDNEKERCQAQTAVLEEAYNNPTLERLKQKQVIPEKVLKALQRRGQPLRRSNRHHRPPSLQTDLQFKSPNEVYANSTKSAHPFPLVGAESNPIQAAATSAFENDCNTDMCNTSNLPWPEALFRILGKPEPMPNDLHGLFLRRNLTVHDETTGEPILQRFGARKRYLFLDMVKDSRRGRDRFDKVLDTAVPAETMGSRTAEDEIDGHYHFGVWYGQGCTFAVPTPDTKQEGN